MPVRSPIHVGSRSSEDGLHEGIVIDLNPSGTVGVQAIKRFGELFNDDASADEAVECNSGWASIPTSAGSWSGSWEAGAGPVSKRTKQKRILRTIFPL